MTEPPPTLSAERAVGRLYDQQIRERVYRAKNWLSIYAFILVVYGGALITDYLLFALIGWVLREDITRYPLVALWFDYARTGLAMMLVVAAVIHGILSTISQVRLDLALFSEETESKGKNE